MKVIFNRLSESSLLACFYCKRKILLINIMKIIKSTVGIVRPYYETVQKKCFSLETEDISEVYNQKIVLII